VRRALATTVVAGLVLLGCTGTEDDNVLDLQATQEPDAEETEEPEPEETEPEEVDEEEEPEPEDPYAVPDEIDEDYVERVINAILEVQSEVLRGALQQEQGENLDVDLTALHFATTDGTERMEGLEEIQGYIDEPSRQTNFRDPEDFGASTFSVEHLVHAETNCIIVVGHWDISETVLEAPPEDDFSAFSLSRIQDDEETSAGNPTPWRWRDSTQMMDAGGVIPREEWEDLDYAAALDHSCEMLL
jgi:hypothetical protein